MNKENGNAPGKVDIKALKKTAITRALLVLPILGLMFFLPAGTLRYWEAWAYLIIIIIPMVSFGLYMFKNDPMLLERRMRTKEKQKDQRLIIKLSLPLFLAGFILPGFDRRYGWSSVPEVVIVFSLFMVLLGYLLTIYVLKTNSYASRIIEVENGQRVISTGPYAVVRHPMYVAVLIMYGFSPLALGSYWAMIPMFFSMLIFIPRITGEERELMKNLEGYREYAEKTRFRLVPGIW